MATSSSGIDHSAEQTPRQVVYRRFASETRTVEVMSTAPWTVKGLRPDSETASLTFPNSKEQQVDKVLKLTNAHCEQPYFKSGLADIQYPEENDTKSEKDDRTLMQDKAAYKSALNSVLDLRSSQDKPNICETDTISGEDEMFRGRRLTLAQRDKVIGGAATIFTDPINFRKITIGYGESQKSEYDIGRLSSATFMNPENRTLTEPAIKEHIMPSTTKSSQQPVGNNSTVKAELQRSSFPVSDGNVAKTGKESFQLTSNKSHVRVKVGKSMFTPEPTMTLKGNTPRENMNFFKPKRGKDETYSDTKKKEDSSLHHSEDISAAKVQENKAQTLSNASSHVVSNKSTLKSDSKVTLDGHTLCLHFDKSDVTESKREQEKGYTQSNRNVNSFENEDSDFFHSKSTKLHEPKLEENKVSSNTFGLHFMTENTALKGVSGIATSGNSLSLRSQNTRLSEAKGETEIYIMSEANVKSCSPCPADKTSSSSRIVDTSASGSKVEGNQIKPTESKTSDSYGFTDKHSFKNKPKGTSSNPYFNNPAQNKPETAKEKAASTPTGSLYDVINTQSKIQQNSKSALQGRKLFSEDETKCKENSDVTNENTSSTRKDGTDTSVCRQTSSKARSGFNPDRDNIRETGLKAAQLNKNEMQKYPTTGTNCPALVSSKEITTNLDLVPVHSPTPTKDSQTDDVSGKRVMNERLALKSAVDSKAHVEGVSSIALNTHEKSATDLLSASNQRNPSIPRDPTALNITVSSQTKSFHLDRRVDETKVNIETKGSHKVWLPKHEIQVSSREQLSSRPVTRSKSDVGEGNTGRTVIPKRKSCVERRCCGAQSRPWQEPASAHSLSRASPMGNTASLAPKNKSSWTPQRALESEVQQLKRELQMHKAEELRLQREIHKLRSVLQQATSFGEQTAGTSDPDDGALLASLQDRHGMAGASGVPVGTSKKQGVSGESCEPESVQVPRHEKDIKSRQLIKAAILDNDFLKNLARCQIRELVDCMYPQRVQAGSYVIREGEAGSHLYVLDDGEMEVLKEGTVLGRMGPGKAFGELAILYNCTRTASIRAVSDLQVWVLDRRAFQQIMMRTGMQRLEDNVAFLRSVPLLRGINEQTLARIADALEPEFYPTDEYIVRQGARGNTFFIISGGSVEVTQRGANGFEVVLRTLGRGEYFGEQALLHDDCRTANVRALPPGVDCLTLDRESFNALIGSLSELHHKDYAEDTCSQLSRTSFNYDCRKEDEAVSSLHLEDLRPLGTLGVGGFGCVRLVVAPNGRSYALKCLSKRHVAATGQQEHVAAERDVLLAARSPFIVRLYRTFRDEANVYLLLEACLGGEVWALLREHERLPDKAARFIAACVLEALEYLHARDIVYRDLKPENLVMDADGYVKLVDFGFCKRLPGGCKTWTFCGTPEYVAPEIILNRGHDRAVDYWALGVLIYELVTGAPPFAAADPMGTYNLILLGMESAVMPKYMSRTANHLIRRLCRAAPSERLGYQRGGFTEVKAHRWFQDFDWDALRAQTMTPPIKPRVSGPTDMSNFYPLTLDEELAPVELSHWDADF